MSDLAPTSDVRLVVHEARRNLGLDVDALAARAGLAPAVVARFESGEPVRPEAVTAMVAAVGLDPVRWVGGLPLGLVPVTALDDRHAQVVEYLGERMAGSGDWVMFPDASALLAKAGWSQEAHARAQRRLDRQASWVMVAGASPLLASICLAVYLAVTESSYHASVDAVFSTVMLGALLAVLVIVLGIYVVPNPTGDPARHILDAKRRADGLREVGYAVSAKRLSVCTLADGRLDRRDYLASSVTSVEVVDEDASHVTIRLGTLLGPVELSWVPRARDLLDVVGAWGAGRRGLPTPMLEGPQ